MKLPDPEQFNFKEGIIAEDECILITPDSIKCKWTEETLKFRSMIVRKTDNYIISRGFDKFFNYEEQPELDKFPDGPFDVIEKKDGSLIIWGIYKDVLIHRTRGTFDASNMANGHEIQFLKEKYPQLLVAIYNNPEYSILTEWQTKTNVIVISEVSEPTLTLVGVIHNETGKLVIQSELDKISETWGLDRPKRYHYDSILECISDVELWNGKEGVVLYSEDGQKLRKCKSEWYRSLHSMATGIKTVKNVLDVFMTSPRFTTPKDFFEYLERTMDHEIAVKCKDFIDQICEAYTIVKTKMIIVDGAMEYIKTLHTRKEQAQYIMERCNDWMVPYAFSRLDGKELDDKLLRKALEQELKI
jgi:T4 RnlA family RNA ligase